jgi:imidazolonepropionase-like amidohydrolase
MPFLPAFAARTTTRAQGRRRPRGGTQAFRRALLAGLACAAAGCATPATPTPAVTPAPVAAPAAPAIALVGGEVWTADARRAVYPRGTVVFRGGRLVAVGDAATPVPAGAIVIDVAGKYVTPGLIDAHSHLGVYASPEVEAHADGNEMTAPITAEVSAEHGFWPQDPGLPRAAEGGVTALLVLPGSANLIGGRGFAVKNRPGRSAAAMRFPGAPPVLKMACGENPKRVYGKKSGPATRMGNLAHVRTAFVQAADYLRKWETWAKKGKERGEPPPPRDLKLETLGEVLRGRILVQNHCYRADEMLLMLDVAAELGFTIRTFHHALEAYKIADVLARRGVAVATWADWWGFKLEAFDGVQENLAQVHAAGGRAIVHSDSPLGIQRLNLGAAQGLAVGRAAGLPVTEQDALRWITINPAWALGVEAETGSLEAGKMADVVVWSHMPLSIYARAERVFVDGQIVFDRSRGSRPSDFELGLVPEDRGAAPLRSRPGASFLPRGPPPA